MELECADSPSVVYAALNAVTESASLVVSADEKENLLCIANGANEKANELFRKSKIGFLDIASLVGKAVEGLPSKDEYTLSDVLEADRKAREFVEALVD